MKKVRVLALVLVFAFAALGGAYAMWYDSLFINETVTTGIVDIKWQDPESSDPGQNYEGTGSVYQGNHDRLDPGNDNEPKNVGSKNVELADDTEYLNEDWPAYASESDPRFEDDVLNITLTNGYPGYQEYIDAYIANVGTVPVLFEITELVAVPEWMHVQIVDAEEGTVYFDSAGGEVDEMPQLDPDKCINVKIIERVLQSAPQQANAEFELQLKGIQWNEYGFPLVDQITADAPAV